jgi:hypothetical protein
VPAAAESAGLAAGRGVRCAHALLSLHWWTLTALLLPGMRQIAACGAQQAPGEIGALCVL